MEEERKANENTQGPHSEKNQPEPSSFGQNIHASGRRNCHGSSIIFAPTRNDWGLPKNMNKNIKGMLPQLMMMMQKNQEREEERDMRQIEIDEECCLQEEHRHMEDEVPQDWMNMEILMMFEKVTGVDPASMWDIYGG
ncbi:hypothetical protein O181_091575 [Austropuccinia psidii MF-1]|uniref:Uncharacterized protein n=1 Tax=Austropuccinia psidii MF-1 TaxID=1389203 RepID=A0A9Q3IY17_9BASI|nr:hypothetical protein [Austropuccinia psidii MF-1]